MPDSYPFPTYSGLLEPRHYQNIGSAIWLFLWCISSTTKDVERDGVTWGIVLGNKPLKLDDVAEVFGVTRRTITSWIKTLEDHDYIRVTRAPYGLIFSVKNSKKYKKRQEENFLSVTDGKKTSCLDEKKTSYQQEEVFLSNKDITEIHNAAIITDPEEILRRTQEIESYFIVKRGKGFQVSLNDYDEIKKLVASGIPLDIVKRSIDKSFAEYKPKHVRDEIRNVSYCIPRCYDEWIKTQVDTSITSPVVPSAGSVALGGSRVKDFRSRQEIQNERAMRKIREAEERDRSRNQEAVSGYPKLI
jgi:hypothetical protein